MLHDRANARSGSIRVIRLRPLDEAREIPAKTAQLGETAIHFRELLFERVLYATARASSPVGERQDLFHLSQRQPEGLRLPDDPQPLDDRARIDPAARRRSGHLADEPSRS